MAQGKGLKRLAFFIIFLIPVLWYLFIQFFGSNNFALEKISDLNDCQSFSEITVLSRNDTLSITDTNYMNRVIYGCNKREVGLEKMQNEYFECIEQPTADLVLINEEGVWGSYELSRSGVDRLLTEIDILVLQNSYGKGTKR